MSSKKIDLPYIFTVVLVILGAIIMFIPFFWMVVSSLKSNMEIISTTTNILPEKVTFEGYQTVLKDAPFLRWLSNSLLTSVIITAATLFSSALAGYIFSKFQFRGKNFMFLLILATMMVPFQVFMIPRYLIISDMGLINSLSAVIIPNVVNGFGIFLCRQFVDSIPNELMEAARMDGASEFKTFLHIVLPQIKPTLAALGIFSFMGAWNDYLWPLIVLNDESKMTVPLALVVFNGQHGVNYNVVMSAAVLIMIPVIAVFLIFQRQFVKGMTLTGMK